MLICRKPLFLAPLSEMYGRTWVMVLVSTLTHFLIPCAQVLHISNVFSIGFSLGCAFAPTTSTLIALRFLGSFPSYRVPPVCSMILQPASQEALPSQSGVVPWVIFSQLVIARLRWLFIALVLLSVRCARMLRAVLTSYILHRACHWPDSWRIYRPDYWRQICFYCHCW